MNKKVIRATRVKKRNSVSAIESIDLVIEDDQGNQVSEQYRLLRGAVIWPHESQYGILLLAGQLLDQETVTILEERLFRNIAAAVEAFCDFWAYKPTKYYYREDPEGEGFLSSLRRNKKLLGKIPLVPASLDKAVEYGLKVIGDFLDRRGLVIPQNSLLATQLQEGRYDAVGELPAITALRYLLCGIVENPRETELEDFNLESCLV